MGRTFTARLRSASTTANQQSISSLSLHKTSLKNSKHRQVFNTQSTHSMVQCFTQLYMWLEINATFSFNLNSKTKTIKRSKIKDTDHLCKMVFKNVLISIFEKQKMLKPQQIIIISNKKINLSCHESFWCRCTC